jgi:hypothetical protein
MPTGAEIVPGDNAPPDSIVNVAGIRALRGGGGDVLAEPGAGRPLVVEAPGPVVLVTVDTLPLAEDVVVAVAVPPVAPAVPRVAVAASPVAALPAPVVRLFDGVPSGAPAVLVRLADPQPARSTVSISTNAARRGLTDAA